MFNKNKIDPKIRFQNARFKRHLEKARNYKRTSRVLPQTSWGIFLSKIGLNSWVNQGIFFIIILLFIYLVFVPNVFFVKNLAVLGMPDQYQQNTENSANLFLNKRNPFPQKNLLVLSKKQLSSFLLKNNQRVLNVKKITKKFPSTLIVELEPRLDTFFVKSKVGEYLVSNDGITMGAIEPTSTGSLPNLPILININSDNVYITGHRLLPPETAEAIIKLNEKLPKAVNSEIVSFEIPSFKTKNLLVNFTAGFKLYLNTELKTEETLNRLELLFSQYSNAEINNLYYVDMRFEGRGYTCNKNAPCIKEIVLPVSSASSSTPTIKE